MRIAEAHNTTSVSHKGYSHIDGLITGGRSGHEDHVYTLTVADAQGLVESFVEITQTGSLSPVLHSELALTGVQVDSHYTAAVGAAQLDKKLTQEPESDNGNGLA